MIQVYTGDGKGKTTAAIGQATRAKGQGLKVGVFQFLKAGKETGEARILEKIGILFRQYGSGRWFINRLPEQEEIDLALRGLKEAEQAITDGYDLVVLDEISHAINFGLISLDRVLLLVADLPKNVELVLTGRDMPEQLVARAELVTEMKEVKHPYKKGIASRRGIEY
jgi:cob(I)alamin adenosyltransferase